MTDESNLESVTFTKMVVYIQTISPWRKLPKLQNSWSSLRRKTVGLVQERLILGSPSYAPNSTSRVPTSDVPNSELSISELPSLALPLSQWPLLGRRLNLHTFVISGESRPLSCFNLSSQSYASSKFPKPFGPPSGFTLFSPVPGSVPSSVPGFPIIQVPSLVQFCLLPLSSLLNQTQVLLTLSPHLLVCDTVLRWDPNCQSQTHLFSELFWHFQASNRKKFLSLWVPGSSNLLKISLNY